MKQNAAAAEQKNMNEILRLGLVLFAITFVVALLLGLTNAVTKDRIKEASEKATKEAMGIVMSEADSFESVQAELSEPVELISKAISGGETIGYCVKVSPSGFSDTIEIMVGIINLIGAFFLIESCIMLFQTTLTPQLM